MLKLSYKGLDGLVELAGVHLVQQLLEAVSVVQVPGQSGEGLEAIAGMVVGNSPVFNCQLTHQLRLFGNVALRKHADVRAHSQYLFTRDCIAVECSAVPKDEVASLSVYLHAGSKRLLTFVLLRHQIPIFFEVQHVLICKILSVPQMRPRDHHEPSLILS